MSDTPLYPEYFDDERFFLPALNNRQTKLAARLAVGENNQLRVEGTAGFPSEGVISIDKEIIYYRSKTPTSFGNLTRGFDNTFSSEHPVGRYVELRWVSAHHNRLRNTVMTLEKILGVNPQGAYPDISSRLNAFFGSIFVRNHEIMYQSDGVTPSDTGYTGSTGEYARVFKPQNEFVNTDVFGPEVFIDGVKQIRGETRIRVPGTNITSTDVDNGLGLGIIECNTADFVSDGVIPGDIVLISGSSSNDGAYIVDTVLSVSQIRVTEQIFGVDGSTGAIQIFDVSSIASSPQTDFISTPTTSSDPDSGDTIILLDPPVIEQQVRVRYEAKNLSSDVVYEDPVATVAQFRNPSLSGTVPEGGSITYALDIGRTRAIAFKVRLATTGANLPTNISIEIFGASDITNRQYFAEFIDMTIGQFRDYSVWHFHNSELPNPLTHMNVRITDNDGTNGDMSFIFEMDIEALGDNQTVISSSFDLGDEATPSVPDAPVGPTYWIDTTDDANITVDGSDQPASINDLVTVTDKFLSQENSIRANSGDPVTVTVTNVDSSSFSASMGVPPAFDQVEAGTFGYAFETDFSAGGALADGTYDILYEIIDLEVTGGDRFFQLNKNGTPILIPYTDGFHRLVYSTTGAAIKVWFDGSLVFDSGISSQIFPSWAADLLFTAPSPDGVGTFVHKVYEFIMYGNTNLGDTESVQLSDYLARHAP